MTVKQLIELLKEQPPMNQVYVAGFDPRTGECDWDGSVEDVRPGKGSMAHATFIEFNQLFLNIFIDSPPERD